MKNGKKKMNRVEIQERLKDLRFERAEWMRTQPVSNWNNSPQQAEMNELAELMHNCWFGECECTEWEHELSSWSKLTLGAHEMKDEGNFEGITAVQQLRVACVSDTKTRVRMLSELRWLRAGAVSVDKATLRLWKKAAEDGDGKFAKILKVRDASLAAKHRDGMRGGVSTV